MKTIRQIIEGKGKGFSQDAMDAIGRMANDERTDPGTKAAAKAKLGLGQQHPDHQPPKVLDLPTAPEEHEHHDILIKHGYKNISSGYHKAYHNKSNDNFVKMDTRDPQNIKWRSGSGDDAVTGSSAKDLDNHLTKKFLK